MTRLLLSALLLGGGAALCSAADFEPPVRLRVGDAAIRVESPGYAAPCWADIHGKKQLLVGQFKQGKIQAFKHLGAEKFAPGNDYRLLVVNGRLVEPSRREPAQVMGDGRLTIRELVEMSYEFDAPFVLDTTKYQSTFGTAATPLPSAIAATVAWYQQRNETSEHATESVSS